VKIVLFDIDGTLLLTDGAGRRAIHAALVETFGRLGTTDHWFDGKTDRQIVRELMRIEGFSDELINSRMEESLDRYLTHLDRELESPHHVPKVFAGVAELLEELASRDDVVLGLLTGNLQRGAMAKLRRVDLDPDRFSVGAFGSDHEDRHELPSIAQRRATALLNEPVHGSSLVVIGDTPSDILCGRGIGARAIGVATGRFTVDDLQSYEPAAVFGDLTPTTDVVRAIIDA
jgi:phosphoglycolate phosphatase-like HAD superfamily hydrolase